MSNIYRLSLTDPPPEGGALISEETEARIDAPAQPGYEDSPPLPNVHPVTSPIPPLDGTPVYVHVARGSGVLGHERATDLAQARGGNPQDQQSLDWPNVTDFSDLSAPVTPTPVSSGARQQAATLPVTSVRNFDSSSAPSRKRLRVSASPQRPAAIVQAGTQPYTAARTLGAPARGWTVAGEEPGMAGDEKSGLGHGDTARTQGHALYDDGTSRTVDAPAWAATQPRNDGHQNHQLTLTRGHEVTEPAGVPSSEEEISVLELEARYKQDMATWKRDWLGKQVAAAAAAAKPRLLQHALDMLRSADPEWTILPERMDTAAAPSNRRMHDSAANGFERSEHPPAEAMLHHVAHSEPEEQPRRGDIMLVDMPAGDRPTTDVANHPPRAFAALHPRPRETAYSSLADALRPGPPNVVPGAAGPGTMPPVVGEGAVHPLQPLLPQAAGPWTPTLPAVGGQQDVPIEIDPVPSPTYTLYGKSRALNISQESLPPRLLAGPNALLQGLSKGKQTTWGDLDPDVEILVQVHAQTDFCHDPNYLNAIKALIIAAVRDITQETGFTVIKPDKDMRNAVGGNFPVVWLITGLTRVGVSRYRARTIWHFDYITLHSPTVYKGPPRLIGLYKGPGDLNEDRVGEAILNAYEADEWVKRMAAIIRDDRIIMGREGHARSVVDDYKDDAKEIIRSIKVRTYREVLPCDPADGLGEARYGDLIAVVYRDSPVSERSQRAWIRWMRDVAGLVISGTYLDSALVPCSVKKCTGCHAGDHNLLNCPLDRVPGFKGALVLGVREYGATYRTTVDPAYRGAGQMTVQPAQGHRFMHWEPGPAGAAHTPPPQYGLDDLHTNTRTWPSVPPQQNWQPQYDAPEHARHRGNAQAGPSHSRRQMSYDGDDDDGQPQRWNTHPTQFGNGHPRPPRPPAQKHRRANRPPPPGYPGPPPPPSAPGYPGYGGYQ